MRLHGFVLFWFGSRMTGVEFHGGVSDWVSSSCII